jgi:hypothetical protein
MKKMPCLLVRKFHGPDSFTLTDQVTPGCEWVFYDPCAVASRKWDGTACAVISGLLYRRYDVKRKPDGSFKDIPFGAIPCDEPDLITGYHPHWVHTSYGKELDKHHIFAWMEFLRTNKFKTPGEGTYELIGPPIGGNPERVDRLMFKKHGDMILDVPRSIDGITEYLSSNMIEGIVFSHPDGRRCKIRRKDFGFKWGADVKS